MAELRFDPGVDQPLTGLEDDLELRQALLATDNTRTLNLRFV